MDNTTPRRRAAIYARISQKDESVDKVANQEARLRNALEVQGYSVDRVYRDDGVSAWKDDVPRPGWQALQADVAAGMYDVVAAQNPDRFTRAGTVASLLWLATCAEHGTDWFIEGEGLVSTTDPNADIRAFFAGREAQRESATKSKRLRERYASDRAAGRHRPGGHRPFGWNRDGSLNEVEAPLIRWAIDHILGGGSLVSVIKDWNSKGVTTPFGNVWNLRSLGMVLHNPRLYGALRHNGEIVGTGSWQTICTREEFDTLAAVMSSRSKHYRGAVRAHYLLSHIAKCGTCGSPMIARSVTIRGEAEPYYQCRARRENAVPGDKRRHPAMRVEEADELAMDALFHVMRNTLDSAHPDRETEALRALYARLDGIDAELGRLVEAVADGSLSSKDVAPKRRALDDEVDQINGRITQLSAQSAADALRSQAYASIMGTATLLEEIDIDLAMAQTFESLPIEKRRALLGRLRIVIHPGRGWRRMKITDASGEPVRYGEV